MVLIVKCNILHCIYYIQWWWHMCIVYRILYHIRQHSTIRDQTITIVTIIRCSIHFVYADRICFNLNNLYVCLCVYEVRFCGTPIQRRWSVSPGPIMLSTFYDGNGEIEWRSPCWRAFSSEIFVCTFCVFVIYVCIVCGMGATQWCAAKTYWYCCGYLIYIVSVASG